MQKHKFDTVNHNALWNTLREFCVPQHLIWLMQKLYGKATGVLRIAGEHTDQFPFKKGVRQGCVLSPMLFKLQHVWRNDHADVRV